MAEDSVDMTADAVTASDLYDVITFKDPGSFYNREAPAPYIAFAIGGALCFVTSIYWYILRWRPHTIQQKTGEGE